MELGRQVAVRGGQKSGPFIYTAGQSAVEPDGTIIGKGDIKAQTHKAFENIRAVQNLAGADLGDIVEITTYITDESKFNDMLEACSEVFGENLPASTAVIVKALVSCPANNFTVHNDFLKCRRGQNDPTMKTYLRDTTLASPDMMVEIEAVAIKF